MLDIRQVSKRFGDKVVFDNANCEMDSHHIYGLVGRNGAGKTTLLKMISRLLKDHEGDIWFGGESILEKDYLSLPFKFVMDTPSFFPDLSVKEHMLYVCGINGLGGDEAREEINRLGTGLSLNDSMDYYPRVLSRGTQQRFNIALSMLGGPKVCLYDEPFITLDPLQVEAVEDLLLQRKGQLLQVVSSHNLDSLDRICDKYLVIFGHSIHEYDACDIDREMILEFLDDEDN